MIFHILSRAEWQAALSRGRHEPASITTEGFIHCSTLEQIVDTANLFYRARRDLILLCIEEVKLIALLKFEAPADSNVRTGRFPHIYGALNLDAVAASMDFPCQDDGMFALPAKIMQMLQR
jgi:uncharacterized protein (DUF952 family)